MDRGVGAPRSHPGLHTTLLKHHDLVSLPQTVAKPYLQEAKPQAPGLRKSGLVLGGLEAR